MLDRYLGDGLRSKPGYYEDGSDYAVSQRFMIGGRALCAFVLATDPKEYESFLSSHTGK